MPEFIARLLTAARAATLAVLLAGCSAGGPEAAFDNYLSRLERTLGEAPPAIAPQALAPPPRTGQLRQEIEGSAVDALDFLALSGCALQVTVGKRNSSLGRLASDSQRLLLELEFLQNAPACVETLRQEGESQLAATIAAAEAQKRRQLPALLFNATLANREYRQLWSPPARLGNYPAATGSTVIQSLEALNELVRRWLSGDYRFDNQGFELLLGEIARADAGAMASALALQSAKLEQADGVLRSRAARGPLCSGSRRDPASDILDTVVRKFFVGDIQPFSAAVERRRQALMPPLRQLEALLDSALPTLYRDWMTQRDASLRHWAAAPKRHVQQIQALQQSCRRGA